MTQEKKAIGYSQEKKDRGYSATANVEEKAGGFIPHIEKRFPTVKDFCIALAEIAGHYLNPYKNKKNLVSTMEGGQKA